MMKLIPRGGKVRRLEKRLKIMRQERNSTAHFLEHCGDKLEAERRARARLERQLKVAQEQHVIVYEDRKRLAAKLAETAAQLRLLADQPKEFTQDEEADQQEEP